MDDTISRQAAMDAVSKACEECRGTFARCEEKLLALPTVDAVPVEWILKNERMPKDGKGRKAIMNMLEDWRKENARTDL